MMIIDKLLKALEPYKDKVVIHPLSEEEIGIVQSKFKKKLPEYYIEYLRKIGIKQDLVWGINTELRDFQDLSDYLPSDNYFRFGYNGGEDYWLLKFEDEEDRTIYEYIYYNTGDIISLGKTFDELLWEGLEHKKKNYDTLVPNDLKDWCVQFSVGTSSGQFLVQELEKHIEVELLKEPVYTETSPAGVKCYEGEILIESRKLPLKKQLYKNSINTSLYFNWQESIEEMKNHSAVKKIDAALNQCVFKHSLIDYGIMERETFERIKD